MADTLVTCYLGFIWADLDNRKPGWHDRPAGTVVALNPHEQPVLSDH